MYKVDVTKLDHFIYDANYLFISRRIKNLWQHCNNAATSAYKTISYYLAKSEIYCLYSISTD